MTIRADYDPRYFRRFLWMGLGCLAFMGWFYYDALVAYPRELERAEAYWKPDTDTPGAWDSMEGDAWETFARERGWDPEPPQLKPDELHHSIQSQYLYAGVCFLIAVPCLLKWLLAKGTWIEADDEEFRTSWGPRFRLDQVQSVDKVKWEKKGIARVEAINEKGRTIRFPLDDFKYERKPVGEILTCIEDRLGDGQIHGDIRESAKEKPEEKPKETGEDHNPESAT